MGHITIMVAYFPINPADTGKDIWTANFKECVKATEWVKCFLEGGGMTETRNGTHTGLLVLVCIWMHMQIH